MSMKNEGGLLAMRQAGCLTPDLEAHYRTLLYDLDLVAYNNCVFDGDVLAFRKSLSTMAAALMSVAMIEPGRSREVSYNLSLVAMNMDHPYLTKQSSEFNSDNVRCVQHMLACALYHLQSGRNTYDGKMHDALDRTIARMDQNRASGQGILALDTISGRYELYLNMLMLLAFRTVDVCLGTDYASVADEVIEGLAQHLRNSETGLYGSFFSTGSFGFPREELAPSAFWEMRKPEAGQNALALSILHLFCPLEAERAWESFKERFGAQLLAYTAEDMAGCVGTSYVTELGGSLEALLGAVLCSREMGDLDFHSALVGHMDSLFCPEHVEAKIVYRGLPDEEAQTAVYFGLLSQCHCGWNDILAYRWADHYDEDYSRVR